MRLARIVTSGQTRLASLDKDGSILALLPREYFDPLDLIKLGVCVAPDSGEPIPKISEVQFLAPIPYSEKIICVGLNYHDHVAEASSPTVPDPAYPSLFVRFPSSQVGHGQPIIKPSVSDQFDFEGELAVIIGREAWRVSEAEAADFVGGYCCFAENSIRDFQSHGRQVTPGKNFLHSGSIGPCIVTQDEVGSLESLMLTTRLNGVEMQQASLSSMIFSVAYLISYISQFTRLLPGDVIATGTPAGVGALRTPPVWMKPGDVLEVEITNVGLLQNVVGSEPTLS